MKLLWRSKVFHANCFPNENVQSHGPFPSSTCLGLIWASHMWMNLPMQCFHFHLSSVWEFVLDTKSTRFLGEWPITNIASQGQLIATIF